YASAAANRFSSAPSNVGRSSARTRFIRSAKIGSKSAKWQTTSRVLHLPAIGRARSCSRLMPATGCRKVSTPARHESINAASAAMVQLHDYGTSGKGRGRRLHCFQHARCLWSGWYSAMPGLGRMILGLQPVWLAMVALAPVPAPEAEDKNIGRWVREL